MIYFLIPVFNEELNIPNLFTELNALSLQEELFLFFQTMARATKPKI